MLYKGKFEQTLDSDLALINASLVGLDKHAISPVIMKQNLEKLKEDLEILRTLLNNEHSGR